MEARLFLAACIMYVFSIASKWLLRKKYLEKQMLFGLWHGGFLLFILGCAYMLLGFVYQSGAALPEKGFGIKQLFVWVLIGLVALSGFFVARKKQGEKRTPIIKTDLDWANTVYFAGFVASIVMFFFVQAFKIPSASMRNTLLEGDHLFVNKASYGFRVPFTQKRFLEFRPIKKGDIIVFSFPADTPTQVNCGGFQYGRDYVKRVVAGPGDMVEIKYGQLYVNGEEEPLQGYELFDPVERLDPVVTVASSSPVIGTDLIDPQVYQSLWEKHRLEHEFGLTLRDQFGPVIVPPDNYFAMGDNRDNSCDSRFWGPVPRKNIKGTAWFIHWPFNRIGLVK